MEVEAMAQGTLRKRTARRKGSPRKRTSPATRGLQNPILCAWLITLGIGVTLLLSGAILAYFQEDPNQWIVPFGYAAIALTAVSGGYAAGKLHGKAPFTAGLINGALLLAVMLPLSLCFGSLASGHSPLLSVLLHGAVLICSVLGATMGARKSR